MNVKTNGVVLNFIFNVYIIVQATSPIGYSPIFQAEQARTRQIFRRGGDLRLHISILMYKSLLTKTTLITS